MAGYLPGPPAQGAHAIATPGGRVLQQRLSAAFRDTQMLEMDSVAALGFLEIIEEKRREANEVLSPQEDKRYRRVLVARFADDSQPQAADLTGQVYKSNPQPVAWGAYGDIYVGTWRGERVAIKAFRRLQRDDRLFYQRLLEEVNVGMRMSHPNVLSIYGFAEVEERICLVSHWMANRSAPFYINRNPDCDRLKLMEEVASGMEYLHSQVFIIHGDLRADNVLVDENGRAVISDFGMSRRMRKVFESYGVDSTDSKLTRFRWAAPELLSQNGTAAYLSPYSDVWSFAMLCLELVTGRLPFYEIHNENQVLYRLVTGRVQYPMRPPPESSVGLTDDLWNLLTRCWARSPPQRPLMDEVYMTLNSMVDANRHIQPEGRGHSPTPSTTESFVQAPPSVYSQISSVPSRRHTRTPSAGTSTGSLSPTDRRTRPLPRVPAPPPPLYKPDASIVYLPVPSPSPPPPVPIVVTAADRALYLEHVALHPRRPSEAHSISTVSAFSRDESLISLNAGTLSPITVATTITRPSFSGGSSSVLSPISDSASAVKVQETQARAKPIIYLSTEAYAVRAGNVPGLVRRLVTSIDQARVADTEFKSVFWASYRSFTTAHEFLDLLEVDFDSENGVREDRQHWVLEVVKEWLDQGALDRDLSYWRIRAMLERVPKTEILQGIAQKIADIVDQHTLSPNRDYRSSVPRKPEDADTLAHALTHLEGREISRILPGDCIAYLTDSPIDTPLRKALQTNASLVLWVKKTILNPDTWGKRVPLYNFFAEAAEACLSMGNLSSAIAIMDALRSEEIRELTMVKRYADWWWQPNMRKLKKLSKDEDEYLKEIRSMTHPSALLRAMRAPARHCIPRLIVHLRREPEILEAMEEPSWIEEDGHRLVNFHKWAKVTALMQEMLRFRLPRSKPDDGVVSFLMGNLENIASDPTVVEWLRLRAVEVKEEEKQAEKRGEYVSYLGLGHEWAAKPNSGRVSGERRR